ncbi:mechanosensitive ion channel family protein [Flavobacterium beibuense]|uniref:Membrane protein n=1 Tax=Flavobacterium beibuense TaxID=657326 RepID=A0A444W6I4_9FLAO|nr:mechanosensitive ion channel domain-containing protein [Flavobacterium beibuense]RYJ41346.1 Membrane protein [Flavobacterium beibuense]
MNFSNLDTNLIKFIAISVVGLVIVFTIVFYVLKKVGKNPKNILPVNFAHRIKIPLVLFIAALALRIGVASDVFNEKASKAIAHIGTLLFILSVTWFLIIFVKVLKASFVKKYDISVSDNLTARRVYTQFSILERVVVFLIIVCAIGVALMSFESIRSIGVSFLTSAGIAGIIIGFSAQKALGTLLAGIQIAITQPIRLDDVVIVEGEWGRIEEITLTYVVVKIWDKRRLVVPTPYFIEKPFQNWTRNSAEILGTVFIYTDFKVEVDKLRTELTRLLEGSDLWDGQVNVLQVTDARERVMEIRALMSSKDSSISWDLRVYVREKLIEFIQKNYPDSLPRTRIALKESPKEEDDKNDE